MAQPGQFNPKGEDWIAREFAQMRQEIRELKAANPFAVMGIVPRDGGTEFPGNVKIAGTLELPAGIIGNDALTAPVFPAAGHSQEYDFAVTTDLTEQARVTFPVPAGYTKALVMATATLSAYNSTAADDNIYICCSIQGTTDGVNPGTSVKTLYTGAVTASSAELLTGIGTEIFVAGYVRSYLAEWPATYAGNILTVSAIVQFLR